MPDVSGLNQISVTLTTARPDNFIGVVYRTENSNCELFFLYAARELYARDR